MSEVIRQYGLAVIASVVVLMILGLLAGFRPQFGETIEESSGTDYVSKVDAYSKKTAPEVSGTVAVAKEVYEVDELLVSDSGRVSVISVRKNDTHEDVTADVLGHRSGSGATLQTLRFVNEGRYAVRYRITDDATGNEGASRSATLCLMVRKQR